MERYFQKLSEDIHSLESIDQRIEEYVEVKNENAIDSCLFQMIYLTQDDAKDLSYRWRELGEFALHGAPLLEERVSAVNAALQEGKEDIYVHPEHLAQPLTQGVLYLSEQMIVSQMLDIETILRGQLIQESLDILEGVEIKGCARRMGLKDKALQQAVGAGQIWQVGIDGMIAASELYQMTENTNLDRQRGAEILAYSVMKDSFLKKKGENGFGQKLQQSMGTSHIAAENFQQELRNSTANDWLCSNKREQILDMISSIKGNRKLMQAFQKDLYRKVSVDTRNERGLVHRQENNAKVHTAMKKK